MKSMVRGLIAPLLTLALLAAALPYSARRLLSQKNTGTDIAASVRA